MPQVDRCCVVGGSAGGLNALRQIYNTIHQNLSCAIVIILHLHKSMHEIEYNYCLSARHEISEVVDKQPLCPSVSYIAPADYHVLVERDKNLALTSDEAVNFSRPAIDVTLRSAAKVFGPNLLAVVLTGANSDGALGAREVAKNGGQVIVQDPDEAEFSEMPRAALAQVQSARVLRLDALAQEINVFGRR